MSKKLLYLLTLICSFSLFTACSDDDDEKKKKLTTAGNRWLAITAETSWHSHTVK